MDFTQAVQSGFKNYVNFQGRACRSEYWYFVLFILLGGIVTGIIDKSGNSHTFRSLFDLVTLLPALSVAVRRMHDINRSGWWILIPGGICVFQQGKLRTGKTPATVRNRI